MDLFCTDCESNTLVITKVKVRPTKDYKIVVNLTLLCTDCGRIEKHIDKRILL